MFVKNWRPRTALTILSAYCRAGHPDQKLKAWGSFEGWSYLVRQALVWVGLPDPGETREELTRSSDREAAALRSLIQGWPEVDPDMIGLTAAKLIERLEKTPESYDAFRSAVLELCPAPAGRLPGTRSLGNKLRHLRGRVVGGKSIDRRDSHGTAVWFVSDVGTDTASETTAGGGSGGSGGFDSGQSSVRVKAMPTVAYVPNCSAERHDSEPPEPPEPPEPCEEGQF
jgi:hypothetical protein